MMRDPASRALAAFGSRDDDAEAMEARWASAGEGSWRRLVLAEGELAGFVATFRVGEETHVTYWVRRDLWGTGVATRAVKQLLEEVKVRPLHASAWAGNLGSLRVLTKCGFERTREEVAFAAARNEEVVEVFFELR
jgi:RimJ/RimL family protein N-acetyltransferase